jgi:hypothetical protein
LFEFPHAGGFAMLKFNRSNSAHRNVTRLLFVAAVWVLASLVSTLTAFAVERHVSTSGNDTGPCTDPNPCKTIRWAVQQANQDGDIIHVDAGQYVEQEIWVGKNLTIQGSGANPFFSPQTTVVAQPGGTRLFRVLGGTTVKITQMLIGRAKDYAIRNEGDLTVKYAFITKNGDGISNQNKLHLDRVWLYKNATGLGNGLGGQSSADLNEVQIEANQLGVINESGSSLVVVNSSISKNHGNGIENGGKLDMLNATISGNEGMGLDVAGKEADVSLTYVTIAENHPAVYAISPSNVSFAKSIVGKNGEDDQCYVDNPSGFPVNVFHDQGYNVFFDQSCQGVSFSPPPATQIADPELEAADSFPYFTLTHALKWKSPAIDLVPESECGTTRDQRGVSRPMDGPVPGKTGCDAGAYEYRQ